MNKVVFPTCCGDDPKVKTQHIFMVFPAQGLGVAGLQMTGALSCETAATCKVTAIYSFILAGLVTLFLGHSNIKVF